ncbi:hypothetical protein V6N11_050761 [Hibiscus sabdariffa]|uniref:Uncharacterized protein n=1 Tax=Hibiscus sabdariffa TaxID=183260 RepID=A0ABR2TAX6_9ROSI
MRNEKISDNKYAHVKVLLFNTKMRALVSFTHWSPMQKGNGRFIINVVLDWIDIPIARPRVWREIFLELEREDN